MSTCLYISLSLYKIYICTYVLDSLHKIGPGDLRDVREVAVLGGKQRDPKPKDKHNSHHNKHGNNTRHINNIIHVSKHNIYIYIYIKIYIYI